MRERKLYMPLKVNIRSLVHLENYKKLIARKRTTIKLFASEVLVIL